MPYKVLQGFYKSLFFISLTLLVSGCLSDELPTNSGEEEEPKQSEAVPPDGVLETVTWNIEWYGNPKSGLGPSDLDLQRDNVATVMDSLKADLYAFQEIYNSEVLQELTIRLKGYRGFTSNYDYGSSSDFSQQTTFVFNTNVIDSVSSGLITEGQDRTDWSNGRYPLYFEFDYSYENITIPVYAVVIHAKANTGDLEESYNRRKRAAESLYQYLQDEKPDAHIIFLGDFNDDLDVSIYNNESPSPYYLFVEDDTNYFPVTQSITQAGQSSYIAGDYSDLIDHIIVSNEMEPYYVNSSEEIYFDALDFIEHYEQTTSDHLPVWAKFDITQ